MKFERYHQILMTALFAFVAWFLQDMSKSINAMREELAKSNTWIEVFKSQFEKNEVIMSEMVSRVKSLEKVCDERHRSAPL